MKNLVYFIFGVVFISTMFSCSNESNMYTVNIELTGVEDELLIMQQRKAGDWITLDSAMLSNGKVTFTGDAPNQPEYYYFNIKNSRRYIPFFIEAGTITVKADAVSLRSPVVTGSPTQLVYQGLLSSLSEFDELSSVLSQQYRQAQENNDEELINQIVEEFDELELNKTKVISGFAIQNNKSVSAPFSMMNYSYMFELDDLKSVADVLDPSISESVYTKSLNDRIAILDRVAVGQPYVDFTLNDPDGNPVSLSSVADGKYVLVDFWASWCGPCRAENPNVVLAYQRFHDKGFEIFGVSFDKSYDKWIEAIEKDNLTWSHVSDLKYWASEAGKLYGVQSIPHSILLDPEGIIIAKNLRGEELQETLAELMGTN